MTTIQRLGFANLSGGRDKEQFRLNVIFIHGLCGHPRDTWVTKQAHNTDGNGGKYKKRASFRSISKKKEECPSHDSRRAVTTSSKSDGVFWPKDYLVPDVPGAEIWTYGYDANRVEGLFQSDHRNSIAQHGKDLEARLKIGINNDRPIVFVAHALGGDVVKYAICRSEALRKSTKLIIFLCESQRGSLVADHEQITFGLARINLNDSGGRGSNTIEGGVHILDDVRREFAQVTIVENIKICSFQDELVISGSDELYTKISDERSSHIGPTKAHEALEMINADDSHMIKYSNGSDKGYQAVKRTIKECVDSYDKEAQNIRADTKAGTLTLPPSADVIENPFYQNITSSLGPPVSIPYDVGDHRMDPGIGVTSDSIVYHIPFRRNKDFTGRISELEELEEKIMTNKEWDRVSIVGLGGTGKTQVALKFAYTVQNKYPDYSIYWIPALSVASLEQACVDILKKLRIETSANEDSKRILKEHLSQEQAGKWLLILDNADDPQLILGDQHSRGLADYLPESEDGIIIYTTRTRRVAVSLTPNDILELDAMTKKDAMDFLEISLNKKGSLSKDANALELLECLVYLPLAISQAAAYIKVNTATVATYLRLLRSTKQDVFDLLSEEFRDNTRYRETANAIATTWIISFNQLEEINEAAVEVLCFMSCIEFKAIPRSILPDMDSEFELETAIGTLCSYSFITRTTSDVNGSEEVYNMHRLVHLACQNWIRKHRDSAVVTADALDHLAWAFPDDEWENRETWRAFMPHALHLLERECDADDDRSELCVWVGRCLDKDGKTQDAVGWLEEARRLRAKLNEDDPARLESEHDLANAYESNGQIRQAVELLEHVVTIRTKALPEDHPKLLVSQHNLAVAYQANGQVEKAIKLLKHIVAVESALAKNHPDRLRSQHQLAVAYEANGQVEKAVKLLEHIVTVESALAENHPSRLASQHQLAGAYEANGQVEKAVKLLEHVVAVKSALAENHPSRLASQHSLAGAYEANGQVEKAIKLLEHVVAVRSLLAEDHPSRLVSQHELARIYHSNGQTEKAIELLEHVVAVESALAENHPSRLASESMLANSYFQHAQKEKAIEIQERVLAIRKESLRDDHPDLVLSKVHMAWMYFETGQTERAVELQEQGVATEKRTLREDHPDRIRHELDLASFLFETGQTQRAIELQKHVVAVRKVSLGESHLTTIKTENNLGSMYYRSGQKDRGLETLEHVVEALSTIHDVDDDYRNECEKGLTRLREERDNGWE